VVAELAVEEEEASIGGRIDWGDGLCGYVCEGHGVCNDVVFRDDDGCVVLFACIVKGTLPERTIPRLTVHRLDCRRWA